MKPTASVASEPSTLNDRAPVSNAPPANEDEKRLNEIRRRRYATWTTAAIAILTFLYLLCVARGVIQETSRLKGADIALGLAATFFLLLVMYPEALARFSLIKLPLGIEVKLEKLEEKQEAWETILMVFYRIISSELVVDQKYYLRALARGSAKGWHVTQEFKNRLWKLKEFGLIKEVAGQRIDDMFIGSTVDVDRFVELTPAGIKFLAALDKIESIG